MWHALESADVVRTLATTEAGLDDAEAADRLARWGANRPEPAPIESRSRMLARQFTSVVVALLLVAAVLALIMREWANAAVIGAVLVLDVALGFTTESRARRAIESLLALQAPRATVLRAGRRVEIDAAEVVPGDVLILEAGMSVAADARLLHSAELRTSEAALTGESAPVSKNAAPRGREHAPLAERTTMVYAGTSIADGVARAVVVDTGSHTELGRIGILTTSVTTGRTPLEVRLDKLGRNLAGLAVALAALVGAVAWWHGAAPAAVATLFIAVAVAAIPEGLPAVVTIAMAMGAQRMARRHAIVRRLPAIETLGAVTVVCTDKTGTLTLGEMTVTAIWAAEREYAVSGFGYSTLGDLRHAGIVCRAPEDRALARVLAACVLANRAELRGEGTQRSIAGDPTEAALLVAAAKAGISRAALLADAPEIAELPFSSDRMLMATVHRIRAAYPSVGTVRAFVKGAPHRVLSRCALDAGERARLLEVNAALASQGLRVLAVAQVDLADAPVPQRVHDLEHALRGLTLLGFVGMIDPPAPNVQATIATLQRAGIRTVMLTGDQRGTATAVGRALGVVTDDRVVIDGEAIDAASDQELHAQLEHAGAISRVSPEGKLRAVRALSVDGDVVAMLGDGVNDAPALRQADVGVAMGRRGTDVAREVAGVVLQDDRFETIAAAVEEGRRIFDNIRRVALYLLAGNLAELVVILGGELVGMRVLTPLQILWINLVTDGIPALALAVELASPGIMTRPPRHATESLLPMKLALRASVYALVVATATFAAYAIGAGAWPWTAARETVADAESGGALAFMTLALSQLFLVWVVRAPRSSTRPARGWLARVMRDRTTLAVLVTSALQLGLAVIPGVARTLGLSHLGWWGVAVAASLAAAALVVTSRLPRRAVRDPLTGIGRVDTSFGDAGMQH
jgi:Ca2+-transporting ATPase